MLFARTKDTAFSQWIRDPATLHQRIAGTETRMLETKRSQIIDALADDPWLRNFYLSIWEKAHFVEKLETYPWHQSYGLVDVCNANCGFCPSGYEKSGLFQLKYLDRLQEVISYARTLTFTGGEVTVHPHFKEIMHAAREAIDPRCFFSIISNAARLGRYLDVIEPINMAVCVSLNAGTAATHDAIMKLGPKAWDDILATLRTIKSQGKYLSLSFVVTKQNIHEVPQFLAIAEEIGANAAYVRTLNPMELSTKSQLTISGMTVIDNYPELEPTAHPDFERLRAAAQAAIKQCTVPVMGDPAQWSVPGLNNRLEEGDAKPSLLPRLNLAVKTVGLPRISEETLAWEAADAAYNPYNRSAPFSCDHVYYGLLIDDQSLVYRPCCFMGVVPNYEPVGVFSSENFMDLRNSPAFLGLRRSLAKGPLFSLCRRCTYQIGY